MNWIQFLKIIQSYLDLLIDMKGFKLKNGGTAFRNRSKNQYAVFYGLTSVGHGEWRGKNNYEVAISMWGLPGIFIRTKSKPMICNQAILNVLLFFPYIIYLMFRLLICIPIGLFYFIRFMTIAHPMECKFFGNEHLVACLFWQISAIVLFLLWMLK